ncbi:histidine phosphatase family protein [Candidatus Microgenomates bacterium]|nr:histidine phosphatase family protein [Candidatus Microgenomates bacterium]
MVTIIFESHGTTVDNEKHVSSGHSDAELSPAGIKNAEDLGERRKDEHFDAIFCSDLQRSYKTAEIAFGDKFPVIKDARLRECDYGDLTGHPSDEVEPQKINHITEPFPNGESYEQAATRMKEFLDELKKNRDGQKVLIIGHRATQYGLEHLINGRSLQELLTTPFVWQPGWEYGL